MHVPDGFLSPVTWVPATIVAAGAIGVATHRSRRTLGRRALPRLSVTTALAFVLGSVALPIPGGTTVHATGVALLATQFGAAPAFLASTGVLALQALLFGVGGVTSLAVNALCIGGGGAIAAGLAARVFRPIGRGPAIFAAGWFSIVIPAAMLALVLGWQPSLGRAPDGTPLFFPFSWNVTLPALLAPAALLGLGEGSLTLAATRILARISPGASE